MSVKLSKKQEEEIKYLQTQIKIVWPDYSIPKELLVNPTSEFIGEFFAKCLNELEKHCFLMYNCLQEERLGDLMVYCPANVDRGLFLYVHVKHVMDLMNVTYSALTDFYMPVTRTRLSMKIFTNFLLFVKQNYHKGQQVVQGVNEILQEYEQILERHKQMSEELAEIFQENGQVFEAMSALEKEQEEVYLLNEDFKKDDLKQIEEKEEENSLLELQLKELEEQIRSIDESNTNLRANIVTEEDFNIATQTTDRLKLELALLNEREQDRCSRLKENDNSTSDLKHLRTILESVDFSDWDRIKELHDAEAIINEVNLKKVESQRDTKCLTKEIKTIKNKIKTLKNQTKTELNLSSKKQKKLEKKHQDAETAHKIALSKHQQSRKEVDLIEENIEKMQMKCEKVKKDIQEIREFISINLENSIALDNKLMSTFNDKLCELESFFWNFEREQCPK